MKKVLVVDDDENIRRLILACLRNENYELSEACDGNEALSQARSLRPDLIILDVMMPDKRGYEVCEELKKDPATKHSIVLFITARGGMSSRTMGELMGGDDYMAKPFRPTELVEKVRKLLGRH